MDHTKAKKREENLLRKEKKSKYTRSKRSKVKVRCGEKKLREMIKKIKINVKGGGRERTERLNLE